jgi:hypothetical protein
MEEEKDLNDLKKLLSEKHSSNAIREILKWYNWQKTKTNQIIKRKS